MGTKSVLITVITKCSVLYFKHVATVATLSINFWIGLKMKISVFVKYFWIFLKCHILISR